MKKNLTIVLLFTVMISNAQTTIPDEQQHGYCDLFETDALALVNTGVSEEQSTVLSIINEIIEKVGIARNFVIRKNPKINNLRAEIRTSDGIEDRYISYNPEFVKGVELKFNKWSVYGAFAHEIG